MNGPFQAYKNDVCLLPNELDEKVPKLHFLTLKIPLFRLISRWPDSVCPRRFVGDVFEVSVRKAGSAAETTPPFPKAEETQKTPGLTQKSSEMRHVVIHEVLRGSLTTPGWQPEETVPCLPQ